VAGQRVLGRLSDLQTASMIKVTCNKPHERMKKIDNVRRSVGLDRDPTASSFGVESGERMAQIGGRILACPPLRYGGQQRSAQVQPRSGAWNMKGKFLHSPSQLGSWVVLNFCGPRVTEPLQRFIGTLVRMAEGMRLRVTQPRPPVYNARPGQAERIMQQAVREAKSPLQLIFCVKPDTCSQLYREIKIASDTVLGVPSQCVLQKHVFKSQPTTCANVCLKINTKLGGRNVVVDRDLPLVSDRPTMILGADVTHPSVMDTTSPSIAAVRGWVTWVGLFGCLQPPPPPIYFPTSFLACLQYVCYHV
jgi:eukaryotic translation initiation factor 2C